MVTMIIILLGVVSFLVGGVIYMNKKLNTEVQTKEGYTIKPQDWKLFHNKHEQLKDEATSEFFMGAIFSQVPLMALIMIPFLFLRLFGFDKFVENMSPFTLILPSILVVYFSKKIGREFIENLQKEAHLISFHTKGDWTKYGHYIHSVPSYQTLLKEYEEKLTRQKHLAEKIAKLLLKKEKLEKKQAVDFAEVTSQKLETVEKELLKRKLLLEVNILQVEELKGKIIANITDVMPEVYAAILGTKKEEPIKDFSTPFHVSLLEEAVNDATLPESVRDDARETLKTYYSKQSLADVEAHINDVKLNIETAKKML